MGKIIKFMASVFAAFSIPFLLNSCSDNDPDMNPIKVVEKQVDELENQLKAKIPELESYQRVQPPIQSFTVSDETPSIESTGLSPIKDVEDLTPLLDLTVKRGGTVSYASMGDKNLVKVHGGRKEEEKLVR
jgi:hypothetical protein